MPTFIIAIVTILLVVLCVGAILYFQSRRSFRDQKNYERALKIVPILIHLPPVSDDTDLGGRDVRDVTEETISKAQVLYSIIASTFQKGFKGHFYGQRHFAFEIVGFQGFVYFYVAVPVALEEVIKQAVVSAYPTARLEEVNEHNIFSPVGKITGTIGGELNLKQSFAYPIATYQDLKRDAMQALLNALSTLGKEDGAGIQILMRPANPSWRKQASAIAARKRKGTKSGFGNLLKDFVIAFSKPPGENKDASSNKTDLTNLDQNILDSIDDKTRHPGYEVLIRLVVSSNITQRSQAILGNIVASFSLYDAPGKNGFKYTPAKDMEALATAYIMRFFPQQTKQNILNSVELATLFHFPDQRSIPTSQLTRQDSKQVDGPRNIPADGLLLGYNIFRGSKKPIRTALNDRQRHMYVVGQTGTGKSTFLENLALQDMLNGEGFAFVDPHGDTVERLLAMVPKERTEDLIYFSPADMDYPMGLNLFEFNTPDQKDFLIQEALNMLYKLYDPQHQGIMGPRYEHLFRNAALTIMADPQGGTFVDIPKLFRDPRYVQQKLQHVKDQNVIEFWQKEMPASQRSNEFGEVVSWFVSKFGAFLSNEMMRNIIGQTKSAFDLRSIMDNKKILLVNLSKGRTGELNSKLLGMVFVMKFQAAAMSRSNISEDKRIDFALYVDEFQNFSTDSFATIMSEARKYHLNLIVANQFTTQLTPEIRDAVFGNMGTIVSFRVGQNDVEALAKYFQPVFEADDLLRIPNYNTITRTLISGVPTQPFSMATLPPLGTPNMRLSEALKQLSAAKYGRPRAQVEKEIFERLATKPEPKTSFGSTPGPWQQPYTALTPGMNTNSGVSPGKTSNNNLAGSSPSFLDEWLNKRQGTATNPVPTSINSGPRQLQTASDDQARTLTDQMPSAIPKTDSSQSKQQINTSLAEDSMDIKNISSDQIEKQEVDKIADTLKQDLKDSIDKSHLQSLSGEIPIQSTSNNSRENTDDTIYIDREGNLHHNDQPPQN
ncbi:MAG TPA: ATP-binding protein [Candidatus Dormibacteraeota bacterium]|nr:ATP-binding protein [Candidatus Dormibacteraeota bacterium]